MIQKRNVKNLPRDQEVTIGDQIIGLDAETNLLKLFDAISFKGEAGVGIVDITLNSQNASRVVYDILLSNNQTFQLVIPIPESNTPGPAGRGIESIMYTSQTGRELTYTVTYTDGSNDTIKFLNGKDGKGVQNFEQVGGTGAAGTIDTYRLTYTDGNYVEFDIRNGANGTGSGDMLKSENLGGLADYDIARTNLGVYSKAQSDANYATKSQYGYAPLDSASKIPSQYLPSYVDDVIDIDLFANLPATGESGKIYVVYGDTTTNNGSYRWGGTQYSKVSSTSDAVWGHISGSMLDQTDLQNALSGKANLTGGNTFTGSQTINGYISHSHTSSLVGKVDSSDNQTIQEWYNQGTRHAWVGLMDGGGGISGTAADDFVIRTFNSKKIILSATGSTSHFSLDSAGKVFIGYNSIVTPYTSAKLSFGTVLNDKVIALYESASTFYGLGASDFSTKIWANNVNIANFKSNGLAVGLLSPVSIGHFYQNNAEVGAGAGLTIEQDGTGDAKIHILRTGIVRWGIGSPSNNTLAFSYGALTSPVMQLKNSTTNSFRIKSVANTSNATIELDSMALNSMIISTVSGAIYFYTKDGAGVKRVTSISAGGTVAVNTI